MNILANIIGYIVLVIIASFLIYGISRTISTFLKGIFKIRCCKYPILIDDYASNLGNFIGACFGGPMAKHYKCLHCKQTETEY